MTMKTVFLDRDGTINVEKNYLYRKDEFEFIENAPQAIALLKRCGYRVIVVSNQAGVARGYYQESDVCVLHSYINDQLKEYDTCIDAFYFCPHHPDAGVGKYRVVCSCRKPGIGMFEQACKDFCVDRENSWMIGDNRGDIEAGKRFGLKTIMVRTGYGAVLEQQGYNEFDYIADDLYLAAKFITQTDGVLDIDERKEKWIK